MKTIENLFKQLIFAALLLCVVAPAFAQKKVTPLKTQRTDFYSLLADAGLQFTYPAGYKEIPAINNEDFSYDFAMEVPGKDMEAWFLVRSQKQNWISYEQGKNQKGRELANPDSMYLAMGKAGAIALTGDNDFMIRNIAPDVLARYNADAGKSYLLNLLDLKATKHYKYALLLSLQKNHTGTLLAIYFTNQKDPEFYRYVYQASHCFKFKTQAVN